MCITSNEYLMISQNYRVIHCPRHSMIKIICDKLVGITKQDVDKDLNVQDSMHASETNLSFYRMK